MTGFSSHKTIEPSTFISTLSMDSSRFIGFLFPIPYSLFPVLSRLTGRRYSCLRVIHNPALYQGTTLVVPQMHQNEVGALAPEGHFSRNRFHFSLKSSKFFCRAAYVLLALTPVLPAAQELTLHVDVKLVNVFVNVTDRNGAIVGGLTREDFALAEDGRPQQIAVFERQSELPLNLTLAIDTSGSVRKDMAEEADAARRFAHAILRPQDQMSLLQFATEVRELTPFTNKRGADRSRPRPVARRLGYRALRRHHSGLRAAGQERGPQGAGADLRRRRHGQDQPPTPRLSRRPCATR